MCLFLTPANCPTGKNAKLEKIMGISKKDFYAIHDMTTVVPSNCKGNTLCTVRCSDGDVELKCDSDNKWQVEKDGCFGENIVCAVLRIVHARVIMLLEGF